MALTYIITESNALVKPHYGLNKIPVGVDVSNRKKDDSRYQSGIVRRTTDDSGGGLSRDQKTVSQNHSLIPVNQLSGNNDAINSLPGTQIQLNGTSGIREVGHSLNIHTHYLNHQYACGKSCTRITGRAINRYSEAQAFSSRPNSTFEVKI
jgi:hypothetical protein